MRRDGGTAERVARNSLLKVAVQATRLLSLLFVLLAARLLGPEGFGKFTFAYALAALLAAALDLGMHSLLVREIARTPAEAGAQWMAAATLKLALVGPLGLALAVVPAATGQPFDTTVAVWLLGAALVFQSFIELAVGVFTAFERLEFEFALRLGEKLVLVAVGVGGLVLGGGLTAVAGAFAVAGAVSCAGATVLVHQRFARLRWLWQPARVGALARALGPVAGAFVLGLATTRLVPLVVALVAGNLAAGYFGAGVRIVDVLMVVPTAVVAGVYPVLARTAPTGARFRDGARHAAEILLLVAVPVALSLGFGAPWLTRAVYGARYAPTAPLLAVVGIATALAFLGHFWGFVLLALDRPGRLLAVAALSFGASVAVTPALVRAFGARGGALALVCVEAITFGGSVVAMAPLIGVPLGVGALKVAVAGASALAAAVVVPPGGPWRLAASLLVYAGGVLALRPVPGRRWEQFLRGVLSPGV